MSIIPIEEFHDASFERGELTDDGTATRVETCEFAKIMEGDGERLRIVRGGDDLDEEAQDPAFVVFEASDVFSPEALGFVAWRPGEITGN